MDLNNRRDVLEILRNKIMQRTRGGDDQMRKIQMLFARQQGIDARHFRKTLNEQFGLKLTKSQSQSVFDFFAQGTGQISLKDFMDGLLEKDYTTQTMAETASLREQSKVKWRKQDARRAPFPENQALTTKGILRALQDKVTQRTRGGFDQFRKIYKLFAKADGITFNDFVSTLTHQFGLNLTRNQACDLFAHFDKSGSGMISLREFMEQLLPRDYQDALSGKNLEPWAIKAQERERRKQQQARKERQKEFLWGEEEEEERGNCSPKKHMSAIKTSKLHVGQRRDRGGARGGRGGGEHEMKQIMGHRYMTERSDGVTDDGGSGSGGTKARGKSWRQAGAGAEVGASSSVPSLPKLKSSSSSSSTFMSMSKNSRGIGGVGMGMGMGMGMGKGKGKGSTSLPALRLLKQQPHKNETPGNRRRDRRRLGRRDSDNSDFERSIVTCRKALSTQRSKSSSLGNNKAIDAKKRRLLQELRALKSKVDAKQPRRASTIRLK